MLKVLFLYICGIWEQNLWRLFFLTKFMRSFEIHRSINETVIYIYMNMNFWTLSLRCPLERSILCYSWFIIHDLQLQIHYFQCERQYFKNWITIHVHILTTIFAMKLKEFDVRSSIVPPLFLWWLSKTVFNFFVALLRQKLEPTSVWPK